MIRDQRSELIEFDDGYGDDGVHEVFSSQQIHSHVISASSITLVWIPTPRTMTLPCYIIQTPFISTPHRGTVDTPEIQYVIRGGRVVRQQPPAPSRPIDLDTTRDETMREDDEIIKQLQSTHARISIWSLLASSTTHKETLIRALSRIRVDTTTSPEGLIHMLTTGRASCIVFSEDDLPPEGSDHTRPLHISVGCLSRHVPSILLENRSALNVCPLATTIALGYGPTDFEPSTQTMRAYDSIRREVMGTLTLELMIELVVFQVLFQILRILVSFNLLLGRPWIHSAGAIPSSLHLKVKFIHDGQVITISSTRGAHLTSEPVLKISHGGDDLLMTRFAFDEVQTVELGDFVRDSVPMSFDQHNNTIILDIMKSMLYMPGLGLGRCQHGRSEFITVLDHDPPFGLGFILVEAYFRCMAQLRQERVRSRLHHILFDYPLRPYNLRLIDYFMKASKPLLHPDGSIDEPTDIQHVELHQLFSQLQLRGGAPDTSTTLIAPPSPGRYSVLTMCFPDMIDDYGGIDGVMSSDNYDEELLRMVISQPEPDSTLSYFRVLALRDDEDAPLAPDDDAITDDVVVHIASPDILGHVVGESDVVDPPLSFCYFIGICLTFR